MGLLEQLDDGVYRVEVDGAEGRSELIYLAGPPNDRWVFWNGRVYRGDFSRTSVRRARERTHARQAITAPMPATVIKLPISTGQAVHKGDTLIVLEAMKMELPLRAPGDATVAAVRCREGELVKADAVLVELE